MFRCWNRTNVIKAGLAIIALLTPLAAADIMSTAAQAKDSIVLCTIDDLSGDFSIMSTPKTYGYQLAVKESTSTTSAAWLISEVSWTSVRIGIPTSLRTRARIRSPSRIPGPRKL